MWLWPDLAPADWQAALTRIETATREILSHGRARCALTGPPEALGVAGLTSGLGPLLGYWIARGSLDAEPAAAEVMELHYRHNRARMECLESCTVDAVERLDSAGVRVVVLKGMQTAFTCFPEPATRPLADIDLLIDPADKDAAGAALTSLGYRPGASFPVPPQQAWALAGVAELARSVTLIHRDNPWTIDLQTSLDRRYSNGAPLIGLDALRAEVEPWSQSPCAHALRPAALVLHLACHAGCGLGNLTMIRLAELALAVRSERFSWAEFGELAAATATLSSAYAALRLAELLAPGTVEPSVLERAERQAPPAVRKVVAGLRPASAQRVLRCSLEERFMWTPTIARRLGQVVRDLVPRGASPRDLIRIYRRRLWRVARGRLARAAPGAF